MNEYSEENGIYYFDGDLEKYLIKKGVSSEHIEKMKKKILEPDRDEYHETVPLDSSERGYEAFVPLQKVIGTNRATAGKSVFDNVNQIKRGTLDPDRFTKCLNFLEKMPLNDLMKSYEALEIEYDGVRMVHYVEDDEYFVHNGNHRTLTAMLIGAENIRAEVTNAYCDEDKKKKYLYEQDFRHKYNIEEIHTFGKYYAITFYDGNRTYDVTLFPSIKGSKSIYEYIDNLAAIIDDDIKTANRVQKLPHFLRKIILEMFGKNYHRIEQYIDKDYADESRSLAYRPNDTIDLYELKWD